MITRASLVLAMVSMVSAMTGTFPARPAAAAPAPSGPTGAALAEILARFDAYAESSRQRWGVPGMAVAVIQGQSVVLAKGYGVRVAGEPARVDPATVFQIGSISKSFTATVMGLLVDEGKLAFEDRVVDRYPAFQMADPWVTREFMVWDLMAQHSGLAPYAGDAGVLFGHTRQDIMARLRLLPPVASFRSQFSYVNNLWVVAAAVEEAVTGTSWEALVADRVFAPLGMSSASTGAEALLGAGNVALPHALAGDRPVPMRENDLALAAPYVVGPAGGINASVRDVANYVIAHLNHGLFHDRTVLRPETARWLHTPKTIVALRGPANVEQGALAQGPAFYTQGWLYQLLGPTPLVWHNGGTSGSKAVAAFTPDGDLGVVVLTNLIGTQLPEALMYHLYDLYYGRPAKDYTGPFRDEERAQADAGQFPSPPTRPAPPRDLAVYAGAYRHPYYGRLVAEVRDGRLELRTGPARTLIPSRHWDGDTFAIAVPSGAPPTYTDGFASFALGPDGKVSELRFTRFFTDAGEGRFEREPDR